VSTRGDPHCIASDTFQTALEDDLAGIGDAPLTRLPDQIESGSTLLGEMIANQHAEAENQNQPSNGHQNDTLPAHRV